MPDHLLARLTTIVMLGLPGQLQPAIQPLQIVILACRWLVTTKEMRPELTLERLCAIVRL